MRGKAFYIVVLGFLSGALSGSFIEISFETASLLFTGVFCVCLLVKVMRSGKKLPIVFILFLALSFGAFRFSLGEEMAHSKISSFENQKVALEGIIVEEPDFRENTQRLIVSVEAISGAFSFEEKTRERILISVPLYPEFSYGDRVRAEGKLTRPKNFETGPGRVFDYESYLVKDRIFYMISFAKAEKLREGDGSYLKEKLFALKNILLQNVKENLPEPNASLAGGVFLGGKNSLGEELEEDFRRAGIVHVVVLSGYNVMIVSDWMMKLFSFLPRYGGYGMGALSIVLFALMAGGGGTIVRASLMTLIALLGKWTGREGDAGRALFFAAFLMVLHNPLILPFDFSFQLSFLATLGLIYISPLLKFSLSFLPISFREMVATTIATQIAVLPLLLFRSGEFSTVSLPVNFLVVPLIPFTMLFGFLTSVAGFCGSFIAFPFASLTYLLTSIELKIVEIASGLPFSSVNVPYFTSFLMVFSYALIFLWWLKKNKKPALRQTGAGRAAS